MTLPLLLALSAALIYGNAEKAHKRLLWVGEEVFGGYFELQKDPVNPPNCDELFKEDSQQKGSQDSEEDDELDDLFDDEEESAEESAAQAKAQATARKKAVARCHSQQKAYIDINKRITPGVRVFRSIEGAVSSFVSIVVDHFKHILVLILLFATFIASAKGDHIALRPAQSFIAHYISETIQLIAFVMLGYSMWHRHSILSSPEELTLNMLWLIGLTCIILMHLYRLVKAQESTHKELHNKDGIFEAFLAVPLFALMATMSGIYFYGIADHPSGMAIELTKLTEHAILYVHVALYVWVGMLLKQSPLAAMFFDLLRPWKFEPALLAGLVVVAAALPTAYSGASGIFVIAAGSLIYQELRKAGARRQLALAATAMSGSLGVVLNPCLLIVIIASLNKQVTTDQLYGWGLKVFCLTAFLFLVICILQRDRSQPWMGADRKQASSETMLAFKSLLKPLFFSIGLLVFYWLALDTYLDEHSAPIVLPIILVLLLWITRHKEGQPTVKKAIVEATAESGPHIGALLSLMGLSICLGGVVERAELMTLFPTYFGSIWTTMMALVIILVLIGMSMDPYGAVILVSATIANVAYTNGIDPVHFWVVVMVAFELGYLSPPVALNHLLTRQVVGEEEFLKAKSESSNFFDKYERLIIPMIVMGIALVLVAFTPLFFYQKVPEVSCQSYCEKQIECPSTGHQTDAKHSSSASTKIAVKPTVAPKAIEVCIQKCQEADDAVLRACATHDECDAWQECHDFTPDR
jgi:TRAP-type C4-dicarboxylate transport system permease large subunit